MKQESPASERRYRRWECSSSGNMILLNAGELIQCLSYPSLEMKTILDISLESGTYLLSHEGIASIRLKKVENISDFAANNVIFHT
jgi:hypothetical protein